MVRKDPPYPLIFADTKTLTISENGLQLPLLRPGWQFLSSGWGWGGICRGWGPGGTLHGEQGPILRSLSSKLGHWHRSTRDTKSIFQGKRTHTSYCAKRKRWSSSEVIVGLAPGIPEQTRRRVFSANEEDDEKNGAESWIGHLHEPHSGLARLRSSRPSLTWRTSRRTSRRTGPVFYLEQNPFVKRRQDELTKSVRFWLSSKIGFLGQNCPSCVQTLFRVGPWQKLGRQSSRITIFSIYIHLSVNYSITGKNSFSCTYVNQGCQIFLATYIIPKCTKWPQNTHKWHKIYHMTVNVPNDNNNFQYFCVQIFFLENLEPILRFLNLHLQRQRCSRLERFSK
jgi:hypothetical protein